MNIAGLRPPAAVGTDSELNMLRVQRSKLLKEQEKDELRREVSVLEKKYGKIHAPVEARRQAQEDAMNAHFEKMGIKVNRRMR